MNHVYNETVSEGTVMSNGWSTKAYSSNSTPVELTDDLLDKTVVLLMQGTNEFNDEIFSYLQLTVRNF